MDEIKRSYSREELYELVWSMPMQKLATRFGISDRGLAKTCAKHLVPVPPRGYWAKLEAGHNVKKTKLRGTVSRDLHSVYIGQSQSQLSERSRQAVAAAKLQRAAEARTRKDLPPAETSKQSPTIETPGPIPHRFIAALVAQLLDAEPNKEGIIHAPGVAVHEHSRDRAIVVLHNLALACESRNVRLESNEKTLVFISDESSTAISLTEERRRPKHQPTPEEFEEYRRLKAKRDKERARDTWTFGRIEPWPEFDIVYTGKLTLAYANGWGRGMRQSWSDGKTKPLETIVGRFVDGIKLVLVAAAEELRIATEKRQRREALADRRGLAEKRENREDERLSFLLSIARSRREAEDLRTTIALIPKMDSLPAEYQRMIEWAQRRLAELEVKSSVEAIQAHLVEHNLYPDPDELFDPEGDPPPKANYWDD
ncbi:hypothetical protein [Rhizobium miluonense]|uniref:Uncharacterized protein n=1 Tax=Rhizobium miluonense TaxID=411945 RepID=A0A1C3XA55_9HYPH|nr:hypothetical protein [Rhizobium miluonense]SCB49118.1 hypothetical protein GA0061102_107119 [Rhizobium miluonense]